ncbi:LAMT/FAMT [Ilex paraguariensis]|uniref:LAMT/FAMT protein n=2 Tax=Ilex paraguariensis TaxID=185542 RepID=A0ABC8UED1_9AQUA
MDGVNSHLSPTTYHMNGGDGPYSYVQNSDYQKEVIDFAKGLLNEMIAEKLDVENPSFDPSNPICIADLGCSVGPNTFYAVNNIIEAIELKYKSNPQTPSFHVFFNDHTTNDFNTLFKTLPTNRKYFAAGVAGSFHRRLFPNSTLHFVHCSAALHWLSEVPKELKDRNSLAWNKGSVLHTSPVKEVREAYSAQFRKDMEEFLSGRAQELVRGGLMVLIVQGLPDGVLLSETTVGMGFCVLASCLDDMAKTGVVSAEKVDSFNLPFYHPSSKELRALIETNGYFHVERIEKLSTPWRHETPDLQLVGMHLRAVIGGLIEEHFGDEILDDLFQRHIKKLGESAFIYDEKYRKEANYFVFLKRKVA